MSKHRVSLLSSAAAIAVAATLAGAVPASAQVNLGGYSGPVTVKYSDFESIFNPVTGKTTTTAAVGDTLFGILTVTSILSNNGIPQTLWTAGAAGDGFLLGVFSGPTITSITPNGTGFTFTSTLPTHFDIYSSSTQVNANQGTGGYAAAGCALDTLCYNGITNVGHPLQLAISSVPGISPIPTVLTSGNVNALTAPITGSAALDGDVTGGAAFTQFHTLGVTTADGPPLEPNIDFFINANFCGNGVASCNGSVTVGNWLLASQDPVQGNVIPEPNELLVLGMALSAFGLFRWRSQKRS